MLQYQSYQDSESNFSDPPTYDEGLPRGILYNPLDKSCDPEQGTVCSMGPGETPVATIINDIAFKPPRAPPLTEPEDQEYFCDNTDYCKSESKANESRPCYSTHVKNIPLGSIVEVVIYDQARMPILSYPFHLHGTNFHVLDIGSLSEQPEQPALTMDDIEKMVSKHRERLVNKSYDKLSAKDSVMVPQGGWVILRFRADNPGYWAFHCHFELHSITGMQMVVHIGPESDLPPTPPGFPRFGSFKPDICPKQ